MRLRVLAAVAVAAVTAALIAVVGAGAQGGAAPRAFFAVLSGAKEVSAEGERGAGDLNGRGSFSATFDGNRLCYGLTVGNIDDPEAAHIHRGGRNVAGPVVVPLAHPDTGDPGASSDCVRVQRSLAQDIRANPAGFYVNVHNADFQGGAVRGQLFGKRR
jgi:CHRD domain-containing protein